MKAKPIHGTAIPIWQSLGLETVPPIQCALKLGDAVTFTNDAGLKFPGRRVIGFGKTVNGIEPTRNHPEPGLIGSFIHIDSAAPWFPHRPDELTATPFAEKAASAENAHTTAAPENDGPCQTCGATILLGRMRHHKTWCGPKAARCVFIVSADGPGCYQCGETMEVHE